MLLKGQSRQVAEGGVTVKEWKILNVGEGGKVRTAAEEIVQSNDFFRARFAFHPIQATTTSNRKKNNSKRLFSVLASPN